MSLLTLHEQSTDQDVLNYIQRRWPGWNATDEELFEWSKAVEKLANRDALTEAISRHYQESNWRSPRINKIRDHYSQQTLSAGLDAKREVKIGSTGIFVQCVEPPPGKPGYLKFKREVVFPREDQIPADRTVLRNVAEAMRAYHQKTYHGRWMIFWPTEDSDYTYKGL
jgi:hypothetical protein